MNKYEQIYRKRMSSKFWIEIEIFRKLEETTHAQKYEKTHRKKSKCQRRGKKAKRQFSPRKTKQALRKKTKTGINAEKGQASFPEIQTIVAYTDDELASFRYNMVSKNTRRQIHKFEWSQNCHPSAQWWFRPSGDIRAHWPLQSGIHIQLQP